jgi:hypothetical protein
MADYAPGINPLDFLYTRNVYFTNPYSTFQRSMVVKLILNSDNFNFDLPQSDGDDFRLVDGVDTLRMWKAHWSKDAEHAVLFFKLQDIGGGTTGSFKAYWGNSTMAGNSEPETLGVLFYEDFNSIPLSSSKWSGSRSNGLTGYGYLLSSTFNTITNPLEGMTSWTVEAGLYGNWDTNAGYDAGDRTTGFGFTGTENNMVVNIMHNERIEHQIVQPGGGTYQYSIKTNGGMEGRSQNDAFITYFEPEDQLKVKFQNRNNFIDVTHAIRRKVEGDTRPTNVNIYPRQSSSGADGAYPSYINWFIIREYDDQSLGDLDGRDLYIPYETVHHQVQDYREYGPDITNTVYEHESSFGGDPYMLSNNQHDADTNVWVSDPDATAEPYISATINMGWTNDQLVSRAYKHYDSDHIYYYNASKLSDQDTDRMSRNYWHCTTTSGWAAIKFPFSKNIGALRVKFNEDSGTGPKNYAFYGSNFYPGTLFHLARKLDEGVFSDVLDWQSRKIKGTGNFKYFILDVPTTYGDENIKLQEWRMFDNIGENERHYPSQLRLNPGIYGDYMENFPKEIMLEGSIDNTTWTTLIPWTYTATPYVQHYTGYGYWQRYSFINTKGYWSFRLNCRGNWGAPDGRIIVGEWELRELASESYTYRVLGGATNNIQQIWAQEGTAIDDTHNMMYVANEKISTVIQGFTANTKDLPDYYEDFNVV